MQGKPLLIAAAAFVIVLMGGAAIAGVGGYLDTGPEPLAATPTPTIDDIDVPETTTSTKATVTTTATESVDETSKDTTSKDTTAADTKKSETPTSDSSTSNTTDESAEQVDAAATETSTGDKADGDKATDDKADEPGEFVFTLTKPENGATVTSKVVTFGGEASDGVTVHRGKYTATPVDGYWTMDLVVSPGGNHVTFEARHGDGASVTASVKVYYDAPEADQPKDDETKREDDKHGDDKHGDDKEDEKATVPFSAAQTYGSCGEEIPYDVFYGKANPGSIVKVYSEYGSGSTTADANGHWELKVTFPNSPAGKTFPVTVKSKATGETKTFQFTNTQSGDGKDH